MNISPARHNQIKNLFYLTRGGGWWGTNKKKWNFISHQSLRNKIKPTEQSNQHLGTHGGGDGGGSILSVMPNVKKNQFVFSSPLMCALSVLWTETDENVFLSKLIGYIDWLSILSISFFYHFQIWSHLYNGSITLISLEIITEMGKYVFGESIF